MEAGHCANAADAQFAGLITYAPDDTSDPSLTRDTNSAAALIHQYTKGWTATPPLLLVVIYFRWHKASRRREFTKMTFHRLAGGIATPLHTQPAYPWDRTLDSQ